MDNKEKPHWIILSDYVIGSYIFCSDCLEETKKMTNFCRKCGADMRKPKGEKGTKRHMDLISRKVIMKLTKEMYLEIANTEYDVHTISDCTSYVASKCREYIDKHIQSEDLSSAFEGMTNEEVMKAVFGKSYADIDSYIYGSKDIEVKQWCRSPYKGVSE